MKATGRCMSVVVLLVTCSLTATGQEPKVSISTRRENEKHTVDQEQCSWPGDVLLDGDMTGGNMIAKVSPKAFREWMSCTGSLDVRDVKHRLKKLEVMFRKLEGSMDIVRRSGCSMRQILVLFNTISSAHQTSRAIACVSKAFDIPFRNLPTSVRMDDECERKKREMIKKARHMVMTATVLVAASGTCCASPSGTEWCPIFDKALAAAAKARAELDSAREMECPGCSDDEMPPMRDTTQFDHRLLRTALYDTK